MIVLVTAGVLAGGTYLTDRVIAPRSQHPSAAGSQGRLRTPRTAATPAAGTPAASPAQSGPHHPPRQSAKQRLVTATSAPAATGQQVNAGQQVRTRLAASAASSSPTAPPRTSANSSANSALVSYEDETADGWSPFWGDITGAVSTQAAYAGTHCLLLTTTGDRYSAIGTTTNIQGLKPGDEVIYHVWSSGQPGGVRPFAQDGDYDAYFGQPADTPLPARAGWFTLTWTVPSLSGLHAIGMQVTNPGSGTLRLAIDALSWPGS